MPDITTDSAVRHLIDSIEDLDHDHLLALGGIIAARKEDGTYKTNISRSIEYIKANKNKLSKEQSESLYGIWHKLTFYKYNKRK